MAIFLFVASLFAVVIVALFLHQRVVEGISSRIGHYEKALRLQEKENKKLLGRLESCNNTVDNLQRQLMECEQEKRDMAAKQAKG